mmetsp:Transcript_4220/g.17080  ORF Transcript_4220/g.17080 Transcript_4220/m.17080 type:complete len:209 (-) Transcript_4220:1072-1698(-)
MCASASVATWFASAHAARTRRVRRFDHSPYACHMYMMGPTTTKASIASEYDVTKHMTTPPPSMTRLYKSDESDASMGFMRVWQSLVRRDARYPDVVPSMKATSWRSIDRKSPVRTSYNTVRDTTAKSAEYTARRPPPRIMSAKYVSAAVWNLPLLPRTTWSMMAPWYRGRVSASAEYAPRKPMADAKATGRFFASAMARARYAADDMR